jgi:hypothetical protein
MRDAMWSADQGVWSTVHIERVCVPEKERQKQLGIT